MQENEQLRTQSRQLSEKIEELDVLRQRSNRLLKTRVSIDKVLDLVFNTDDPTEQLLVQLLKDDLSATPDELGAFMLALASAWNGLKATISSLPTPAESNEEQRLLRVGVALTHLLAQLSGLYIPARRGVLNTVAQYASASMAHYVFVSPEETRTVNPSIHKTDALGGSIIAEGVTFAVLRRDTRQTIRYAEVKVEKP